MSKVNEMSKLVDCSVREDSAYGKCTSFMRKKQIYTKTDLVNFFVSIGKSEVAAKASQGVMTSPRATSKGDCRGSSSCPWGNLAYNEKLPRRVSAGVKEEQRFRFRLRDKALEKHTRNDKPEVKATKVEDKVVAPIASAEKVKDSSEVVA